MKTSYKKIICILVPLLVVLLLAGVVLRYIYVAGLCDDIRSGKQIDTRIGDAGSAPLWMDGFLVAVGSGVRIPLVEACRYGNIQAMTVLLDNGADPNFSIDGHWSPMEAVRQASVDSEQKMQMFHLLVEHGADVDHYTSYEPVLFSYAPLLVLDRLDPGTEEILRFLLANGASTDHPEKGNSILHYASRGSSVEFVKVLLKDYAVDINAKDSQGQTPLITCLCYTNPSLNEADVQNMVKCLLEHGADVSIQDADGKTAYDYAVEQGYEALAELVKPS